MPVMNAGILKMRRPLPDRRRSWTKKVRIEGQVVYLTVGLYEDGSPGEIFIDVSKAGTFVRGLLGTCARLVSIALQYGADLDVVLQMLRGHDYPPHGIVEGSEDVKECTSVMDWVASELECAFRSDPDANGGPIPGEGDVMPERTAGYVSESWRVGA